MNPTFLVQRIRSKSDLWKDIFSSEDISVARLFCFGLLDRIDTGRIRLAKVDHVGRVLWAVIFVA